MNDETPGDRPPGEEAPKKKISAREMMALREAAAAGDTEAQAKLDSLKKPAASAPAPALPAEPAASAAPTEPAAPETSPVAPAASGASAPASGEEVAPKKKISAREMMALREAAAAGDAEAQATLDALKKPASPASAAVTPDAPAAAPASEPAGEGAPRKKMSAREMMALRKAAEEGDAEAQATLAALKSGAPAAPAALAALVPAAAPEGAEAPKKKMSAREMMALRKAAEEGDATAIAALEALKSGAPAPAAAAPAATPVAPATATAPVAAPAVAPAAPAAPAAPKPAFKPAAPPPPSFTPEQEAEIQRFRDAFGDAVLDQGMSVDMPCLTIAKERIVDVARYCREQGYNFPDEITAVDLMAENTLRVVYLLAAIPNTPGPIDTMRIHRNLVLHVDVPREDPVTVPSVTSVYPGADWAEREAYDLFGIIFEGHPDLRRIMTPDDWEGHPLRKDYTFID